MVCERLDIDIKWLSAVKTSWKLFVIESKELICRRNNDIILFDSLEVNFDDWFNREIRCYEKEIEFSFLTSDDIKVISMLVGHNIGYTKSPWFLCELKFSNGIQPYIKKQQKRQEIGRLLKTYLYEWRLKNK